MDDEFKIKRVRIKDLAKYIHLKDNKSIESWCGVNGLDIHCERKRKFVYKNELEDLLENLYISDKKLKHPKDYLDRCFPYVSFPKIIKLSGFTGSDTSRKSDTSSQFPLEVQRLLNSI